ncbi:hypothetical protein M3Y98_00863600 [Aphelenchoides besseyi]|nr:hypothetical protein M3Y98_00863600 [Aphelenchoides besseyi]KAI6211205.1 hypothetical protein M3Y96_00409100 [Aphelenchoides besseyi]
MMHDFEVVMLLVYIAVAVNIAVILIGLIFATIIFVMTIKKTVPNLARLITVLPTALECCNYAEVPIAIVGVLTSYKQIAVEDLAAEYIREAQHRRALVLEIFQKDPITDRFIANFPSKFIAHGYIGEELLTPFAAKAGA